MKCTHLHLVRHFPQRLFADPVRAERRDVNGGAACRFQGRGVRLDARCARRWILPDGRFAAPVAQLSAAANTGGNCVGARWVTGQVAGAGCAYM